ncbi:MAG: hypothetical protein NVS2B16_14060 [Chloroflexota bacterium]
MSNATAVHVKARSVLKGMGHNAVDSVREYKDWHIEIRSGASYVTVWSSAGMVFLSMSNIPVFYRPGPWEQYLDLLFHRGKR